LLRSWGWAVALGLGVLTAALALGPELVWREEGLGLPGPYALVRMLPGVDGLRAPARWLALTVVPVGLLAALGLRELTAGRSRWVGLGATALVIACALGETPTAPTRPAAAIGLHPAYALLDTVRGSSPLFDEAAVAGDEPTCRRRHALRAAMLHGRPLVGGHYARQHDAGDVVDALVSAWPAPEAAAFLEGNGVSLVLEHPPLGEATPAGWSCRALQGHRLCSRDDPPALTSPPLPYVPPPVRGPVRSAVLEEGQRGSPRPRR
jgi:hypothetical protein